MRLILRIVGQGALVTLVVAGAIAVWAAWVPASHGLLDRLGLLDPLERIGVPITRLPDAPAGGRPGGFGPRGAMPVVAAPAAEGTMVDRLGAIGTGEAVHSVVLMPEVAGRLAEMRVRSGDFVAAGTLVARLDNAAEQIARDRAALLLEEARTTAARFERLQASGTATEVQIREASLAVRQAELAVRQAEFELSRRDITAPISGWVGIVEAEVGATVSTSTPVVRIDDRSTIVVDFRVPERFVGRIASGEALRVVALARPDAPLEGRVRAVDSRVDQSSRSLRIQAELPNPDDSLRAGMAFGIEMEFTGRSYPAVDPLAIQWGNEGAFVWVIRDGRSFREPVRIMQRSDGQVLVQAAIEPGEAVVLEGVQNLREGTEVEARPRPEIRRNDGAARAGATPDPSET